MQVTIKSADFSAAGRGNAKWIENYIIATGIVSAPVKAALRAMYASYISAGFTGKFDVFKLMFTTTALNDSYNMLDPRQAVDAEVTSFVGDVAGTHTLQGFKCNDYTGAQPTYGDSNDKLTATANFHAHVWNTTGETAALTLPKCLLGVRSSSGGNDADFRLMRNTGFGAGTRSGAIWCAASAEVLIEATHDVTKTGLFSFSKTNLNVVLYDNSVSFKTQTLASDAFVTPTPTDPNLNILIGSYPGYASQFSSITKILFAGWGRSVWTQQDETALNNMISTFKTAIGA